MGRRKDIVELFWHIMESGQVHRFAEIWSEDVEFVMPGGSFRGIEPMKELWRHSWGAFSDLRHDLTDLVESGDTVAFEIVVTGTHEGTLSGSVVDVPPTGTRIRMRSVDYVKLEDGKVVSWHWYPDLVGLLAQLGRLDVSEPLRRPTRST